MSVFHDTFCPCRKCNRKWRMSGIAEPGTFVCPICFTPDDIIVMSEEDSKRWRKRHYHHRTAVRPNLVGGTS